MADGDAASYRAASEVGGSDIDRAMALQDGLIAFATGGGFPGDAEAYIGLRRYFLTSSSLRAQLPGCVHRCRTLAQFWSFIKSEYAHYSERREYLWAEFSALLEFLEDRERRSSQAREVALALEVFDLAHVQAMWDKALDRRKNDPEGAITAARALLEAVLKHILDELGVDLGDKADLPKMWRLVAERLNLAPEQHQEEVFKSILGASQTVVNQIATIRNRLGDAHGKAPRRVRPSPRHAALVVNLAGAMAAFVTETWLERSGSESSGHGHH